MSNWLFAAISKSDTIVMVLLRTTNNKEQIL
jgi:hypothetical protein